MFDVGFSELVLIGLVALIVVGPERLPGLARTVGHLLGRLQRYVNDVKSDINREMQIEELKKLQEQVTTQAYDIERQVNEQMHSVETSLNASIVQGIEEKSPSVADALPPAVAPAPTFVSAPLVNPLTTDKPAA